MDSRDHIGHHEYRNLKTAIVQDNNKQLVILGAAESGVGAALLGKKQGWDVFVSDGGTIKEQYKNVLEKAGIGYEEKGHDEKRILRAACLVKSPGISEKTEIMKRVRAAGVMVCSEIELGYRYKGDSKIIAITGSNGKSTTTKLIFHLLKEAGYDVAMVGNIGVSFAKQVAEEPRDWYVIEVSSFQLDDIHQFKPDIAVLLNITPDHLDRYDYKFENYVASKFRITMNQDRKDKLVLNKDDAAIKEYLHTHTTNAEEIYFTMDEQEGLKEGAFVSNEQVHIVYDGEQLDVSIHDLAIKGKHNQYNTMAAGISARVAGIRKEKIRESFSSFEGLEHRLEFVGTVKGVDFINDSKATNVNSVWFALESMTKPTILILGGQDKGNDYTEISMLVKDKVKAIVCLGVDNKPIHEALETLVPVMIDTLSAKEAVAAAFECSERGDVVLLSPGCASFDLFKNYEDRGRQFKEAVKEL